MGKRIEDLRKLDDREIVVRPVEAREDDGSVRDLRDQPWFQFVAEIDELIASDVVGWAEDTLRGIQETVQKTRRVSYAQQQAVKNIEHARGRAGSRRYEGWRRS